MSEWEKVKISDCAQINPTSINPLKLPFEYINYYDISSVGSGILQDIQKVKTREAPSRARRSVEAGDSIIATVRPENKTYYYFRECSNQDIVSTGYAVLRPNTDIIDSRFLYYAISSNDYISYLVQNEKGATYPAVDEKIISNGIIPLPPLPIQKKIAFVLSCYDDLIENCRKQIALLEEVAARLYRKWFVEKGEEEGWERKPLSEITSIVTGKKDANFGTKDGKYLFFTCGQEPIKAPSYSFDCNAVILAGNGDFNVKLYRGKFEAYQRTYVFSPYKAEHLYLLYFAIKENMRQLFQGASGSTIKFLTKPMLEKITVCIPEKDTLNKFTNCCEAYQSKIETLQRQISLLATARDLCLPRLMSGRGSDRE